MTGHGIVIRKMWIAGYYQSSEIVLAWLTQIIMHI
jgi:hypothetical protein